MRVEKTDNEMIMQRLYQQYGKHLELLYETYKTTKYLFKLHFLVVKTNVEITRMLSKTLQLLKDNFNSLDVIFSFSILISLLSTNTLFLYFDFNMILGYICQEE